MTQIQFVPSFMGETNEKMFFQIMVYFSTDNKSLSTMIIDIEREKIKYDKEIEINIGDKYAYDLIANSDSNKKFTTKYNSWDRNFFSDLSDRYINNDLEDVKFDYIIFKNNEIIIGTNIIKIEGDFVSELIDLDKKLNDLFDKHSVLDLTDANDFVKFYNK